MKQKSFLSILSMSLILCGCSNGGSNSSASSNDSSSLSTNSSTIHVHTFEKEYTHDDSHHWHKATCEHSEEKGDYDIHTFSEWNITKQASATEKGQKERTCSTCSFKQVEEIDKNIIYEKIDSNSLYFGRYPQTLVTNDAEINALNLKAGDLPSASDLKNWKDYSYYISNSISSFMYYIDIDEDNDGTKDYRGVYFSSYRPFYTDGNTSNQKDNGYFINTVYWFKYEYIKWNIINSSASKLVVVSDLLLDSQEYSNVTSEERANVKDYQDNESTNIIFSNNYMYSSIRGWLNTTFYNDAFNTLQKDVITASTVDNSLESTGDSENECVCQNTEDNIYLLSNKEVKEFYTDDSKRQATGTDYAKAQGLYVSSSQKSGYLLRSPYGENRRQSYMVYYHGKIDLDNCTTTSFGVRPVLTLTAN